MPSAIPKIAPHVPIFAFYNALYLVPLLVISVVGYAQGGSDSVLLMFDVSTVLRMISIYLLGILAFAAGSMTVGVWLSRRPGDFVLPARSPLFLSDKVLIGVVVAVFLASKVALIPKGVYQEYAFSTGQMVGGVWSFSMFCSEVMILFGIVALLSAHKWNVAIFSVLSIINGINLLHGTRIFFVITVLAAFIYAYLVGLLTLKRIVLLGSLCGAAVLSLAYFVFLVRSDVSFAGAFSLPAIVSPIVYESLFSQISLASLIRSPGLWDALGNLSALVNDVLVASVPRIVLPDKDSLQFELDATMADISPLGALNGYAAGLIYLGYLFPLFYFTLGFMAQALYRKALSGGWWMMVYVYFVGDFLFRLMRDGYVIPIKAFLNAVELILILVLARLVFRAIGTNIHRAELADGNLETGALNETIGRR